MLATRIIPSALRGLTPDGWLLFVTRSVRLFAYGSLSVILVFYLVSLGFSESQTGLLLSLTLAGDVVVSLFLTTRADRIGRRRMLVVGALLMGSAGVAFACTHNFLFLVVAGTVGVISPAATKSGRFFRSNRRHYRTSYWQEGHWVRTSVFVAVQGNRVSASTTGSRT